MSAQTSIRNQEDWAEPVERRPTAAPAVDIYENADEVLLVADLPGVSKDDIAISFEKGLLTIEGRRAKAPEGSLLAAEFRAHDYRRAFTVPQGINAEGISAEVASGVLRVHLPKQAALKPRQIQVRSS